MGAVWAITFVAASVNLHGQVDRSDAPLPFDDAFKLSVDFANGKLFIRWNIEKGYYLYQHALDLTIDGDSIVSKQALPVGTKKDDIVFGNVLVYYDQLEIVTDAIPAEQKKTVLIKTQGCQEDVFCYTPRTRSFLIDSGKIRELIATKKRSKKFR